MHLFFIFKFFNASINFPFQKNIKSAIEKISYFEFYKIINMAKIKSIIRAKNNKNIILDSEMELQVLFFHRSIDQLKKLFLFTEEVKNWETNYIMKISKMNDKLHRDIFYYLWKALEEIEEYIEKNLFDHYIIIIHKIYSRMIIKLEKEDVNYEYKEIYPITYLYRKGNDNLNNLQNFYRKIYHINILREIMKTENENMLKIKFSMILEYFDLGLVILERNDIYNEKMKYIIMNVESSSIWNSTY